MLVKMESMVNSDRLISLVTRFRKAIELAKEKGEFDSRDRMHLFPSGCCDDASDLLGFYLQEQGIHTFQVNGEYRDSNPENAQNHVWLQLNDRTIIDITGDQFSTNRIFLYNAVPVYIGGDNEFYRLFSSREFRENFDFSNGNSYGHIRMKNLYHLISKYL